MATYTVYDVLDYENTDVDRKLAQRAHEGTSFVPDERANQEVNAYLRQMAWVSETFAKFATDDNIDQLRTDLETYRAEYAKRTEDHWRAKAGCVSTMIAGRSGFNVARAEKANARERKVLEALLDWRKKALDRLLSTYDPARIAARPISADDDDAIERLRAKVAEAEANQERMKAANKIARNAKLTDDQKREGLYALGYGELLTENILRPDWGRPGFESYQLSNNNANIKRMKARIAGLEAARAAPQADDREAVILGEPVTVSENTDANRLQLLFEGKPPAEVRDALKSRGFKWAPSQGAWQRQLTANARQAVEWMEAL